MNKEKYKTEAVCPIIIKGSSTGCLPIHVSIINVDIRIQKKDWDAGRNVFAWLFFLSSCTLAGIVYYLHSKVERSTVKLADQDKMEVNESAVLS